MALDFNDTLVDTLWPPPRRYRVCTRSAGYLPDHFKKSFFCKQISSSHADDTLQPSISRPIDVLEQETQRRVHSLLRTPKGLLQHQRDLPQNSPSGVPVSPSAKSRVQPPTGIVSIVVATRWKVRRQTSSEARWLRARQNRACFQLGAAADVLHRIGACDCNKNMSVGTPQRVVASRGASGPTASGACLRIACAFSL